MFLNCGRVCFLRWPGASVGGCRGCSWRLPKSEYGRDMTMVESLFLDTSPINPHLRGGLTSVSESQLKAKCLGV